MEMVPYPNRVVTDHIDIGVRNDRDIAPAIESSMSSTHHVTDITASTRRYAREVLAESLVIAHVVDRESGHDLAMIHPFRGNFEDIVILVMKDRFQVREVDVDRLTTYDIGVDDYTTFYGFSPDLCAEVLGCSAVVLLADIGKSQDFPRHHIQDPLDRIGDQVHLLLPLIKMKTEIETNHVPFLKEVYRHIEGLNMEQTEILSKSMDDHIYCIDMTKKEAFFVPAGSPDHHRARWMKFPMYSISGIIHRFAH
jgi:hypothetical protein